MKPTPTNDPRFGILKTGTTVSDSPSWLDSLLSQIRELREERRNPRPQVEITAQRDPSALDKLVEMPSPVLSLVSDLREAINDYLHPRTIESSVAPVEVDEIWSKPQTGLPRLLSIFVHVLVVSLALVPWATSFPKNSLRRAPGCCRSKHAVESNEVYARCRHERGKLSNQILRFENNCARSISPRTFQTIQEPSIGQCRQTLGCDCGPTGISTKSFESRPVACLNADVRMHTEAVNRGTARAL